MNYVDHKVRVVEQLETEFVAFIKEAYADDSWSDASEFLVSVQDFDYVVDQVNETYQDAGVFEWIEIERFMSFQRRLTQIMQDAVRDGIEYLWFVL